MLFLRNMYHTTSHLSNLHPPVGETVPSSEINGTEHGSPSSATSMATTRGGSKASSKSWRSWASMRDLSVVTTGFFRVKVFFLGGKKQKNNKLGNKKQWYIMFVCFFAGGGGENKKHVGGIEMFFHVFPGCFLMKNLRIMKVKEGKGTCFLWLASRCWLRSILHVYWW